MAKSLRAKSHLQAKSIKRRNVFQKVEDARAERLSEKLKKDLVEQKMKELQESAGTEGTEASDKVAKEPQEIKTQSDKKVSTSGWRNARHHDYKKAKKIKKSKKNAFTKF